MYQIAYLKRNGEVIFRVRNTLPIQKIGEETSMGWIVQDIKYNFNNNYFSLADYKYKMRNQRRINAIHRKMYHLFKKYGITMALLILIPLYLFK